MEIKDMMKGQIYHITTKGDRNWLIKLDEITHDGKLKHNTCLEIIGGRKNYISYKGWLCNTNNVVSVRIPTAEEMEIVPASLIVNTPLYIETTNYQIY